MNPLRSLCRILVLGALVAALPAGAQWPSNPALNLAVADASGGEVIPLVASHSDGSLWIAWFDGTPSGFQVRLQRLNSAGVELWPHNGLLISAHPQNTALFGWDMIADALGNAVIVFSDTRDGGDLDIHAYKIGPTGAFLWGADGVTLSSNPDFEPNPHVAEASDGDLVFVWQRDPASGDGDVRMQRLAPDGTPRLAAGGLPVVTSAGEDPGFADLVAADAGNVIVSWLRNIRTFSSPRHVRAQKFSPTGSAVWASAVSVYDAFSVPIGYAPKVRADGTGGAWLWWHRSDGSLFNSFVQRLTSGGSEVFAHNGVAVSTTPNLYHIDPALAVAPTTGEVIVFYNERNTSQSQWGLNAQKISPTGARLWGEGGITLLPINTTYKSFPRTVGDDDGAMVFLVDQPSGTDRLIGMRVNANGNSMWGTLPAVISSASSAKSRYPVTIGAGSAKIAWEDNRAGSTDIYAQNVRRDGTLGLSSVVGRVDRLTVASSSLTPGDLTLSFTPSCTPDATGYAIYEGEIGNFTSHVRLDCTDDDGDRVEEVTPATGSRYYLVVPQGLTQEGSYGTDSSQAERPPAADACRPTQSLLPCS